MGYRAVVIERDQAKVGDLELQSYSADMPALCADAGQPDTLLFAGLTSKYCRGVITLTNDDSTNLAVAIAARLLAPSLPALCRAEHAETVANMASFGTRHIINPFEKFGEYMALALHSPAAYHLLLWLTGLPGTTVTRHRDPPAGRWVLCGYGTFGRVMTSALENAGLPVTIIDRAPPADPTHTWVKGDGTGHEALQAAGIQDAVGIVAATGHDVNNLSIVVTARQMNPGLFTVLRQNQVANRALFDAFESDFTVVPSEIVSHECLAILTTPLLAPFLDAVRKSDEPWACELLNELTGRFGWDVPTVWSITLNLAQAPSIYRALMRQEAAPTLDELLLAPVTGRPPLACRPLLLLRERCSPTILPAGDERIRLGDQILLVGTEQARRELGLTLFNGHTLQYVLTGQDSPGGLVWEWLARRRAERT
ncbi:MAG: NAD-binding protein, partial [Zoogloea sp.]|nr:NAD-binding protein [Zoogloea sp.]